jgi:hypothetical protein
MDNDAFENLKAYVINYLRGPSSAAGGLHRVITACNAEEETKDKMLSMAELIQCEIEEIIKELQKYKQADGGAEKEAI